MDMVNPKLILLRRRPHEPAVKLDALQPRAGRGRNMPAQRKVFRIEQMAARATPTAVVAGGGLVAAPHADILAELTALRELIASRPPGCGEAAAIAPSNLEELRAETAGIRRLLDRTRSELASLQAAACSNNARQRTVCELNAVATDAEHATQQILAPTLQGFASTATRRTKRQSRREPGPPARNRCRRDPGSATQG